MMPSQCNFCGAPLQQQGTIMPAGRIRCGQCGKVVTGTLQAPPSAPIKPPLQAPPTPKQVKPLAAPPSPPPAPKEPTPLRSPVTAVAVTSPSPAPKPAKPPTEPDLAYTQSTQSDATWHEPPRVPLDSNARPSPPGYKILEELGKGGMGVVYKAHQINLQRTVALKMILGGSDILPEDIARFRGEATAVAQLQHPNIVQIFEVGDHEELPFLALEFVNGPTLRQFLGGRPQPSRASAELVETLARAIHVAHQQGIVHRDLKPANVMLSTPSREAKDDSPYGIPKITDFGAAKRANAEADLQTQSGTLVGTPAYSAPEQMSGRDEPVGPPADVYALGGILYEMLTGRPPFRGENVLDTLRQVLTEEPLSPRQLRPSIPADLEAICLKCLQKDPKRRYPSALELADDLHRYLHGEPIKARLPGRLERVIRWCVRYPVPSALLVAFALCVVFGFWYLSYTTEHLVKQAALEGAAQQAEILDEVNNKYSQVTKRATKGDLRVTHDYQGDPKAIPVPATFSIELGQSISERSKTGMHVRIFSDYPFRTRQNVRPHDAFERDALAALELNPKNAFHRFEEYEGRPVLRYATARVMQQSCVDCHNTHPDSTKTDWKVGELRGAIEIIRPLDTDAARIRRGLSGSFILVGSLCAGLLGLAALVLYAGKLQKRKRYRAA